jgi:uncharacterized protein (TIGR01777 family)
MRVTVTGATGLIGSRLVAALRERGDEVTALSRDPQRAGERLGVAAVGWDPSAGAAPVEGLEGRDGVVNLAGEPIDQRWTKAAKARIRASRVQGTEALVAGIAACAQRPRVLVSGSASGYYGPHGDGRVDESAPSPPGDFLAEVCAAWEAAADRARDLGVRVVKLRTGVVLDRSGGALKTMLPPFRAGLGGPIAGGHQYLPWIHVDDVIGIVLRALDDDAWEGPVNVSAPEPVTNREFSQALGRALRRPAVLPVPALALKLLYGEMAQVVTEGVRMVPARAQALGYAWRHPELDEALRSALG